MTGQRLRQLIREEARRILLEKVDAVEPLSVTNNKLYVKGKKTKLNISAFGSVYEDVDVLKIVINDDKSVVLTVSAAGITKDAPIKDPAKVQEIIDTITAGKTFKSKPSWLGSFEIIPVA